MPGLLPGRIAIPVPRSMDRRCGGRAARAHGFETIRTDTNALYPRYSRVMRWLELCAVWCCGGWQTGEPRFFRLVSEAQRIFAQTLITDDQSMSFQ